MSVRTWKRIISMVVLLLILSLSVATAVFAIKYNKLDDEYNGVLSNKGLVDLSGYGVLDSRELDHLFSYLGNLDINETLDYQKKYSNLYIKNDYAFKGMGDQKICYLTFDDGPDAQVTTEILDILKEYDVKATFFVAYRDGNEEKELYKRIAEDGHTIGAHTASHNYTKIYSSVDAYLKDFNRISNHIEKYAGIKPEIFRFPGGSINSYNASNYHELIAEMVRRGYTYYDWNVSSGDASMPYVPAEEITQNVLNSNNKQKIVLMHDGRGHSTTAEALPDIIRGLWEQGYEFRALDKSVTPVCFGY